MPRILSATSNIKLKREYRGRLVIVVLLFLITLCLALYIFMIPSHFLLSSYEKTYRNSSTSPEQETVQKINQEFNSKLAYTYELSQKVILTDIRQVQVSQIILEYGKDLIEMNSIETSLVDGSISITIRGNAYTRGGLLSFEERINQDDRFSSFKIPIESLTKQADIPFNISFTYHAK